MSNDAKSENVLVFGAHPDDLEIGMGGTVAKLSRLGYNVKLVIATLPNFTQSDKKDERRMEAVRILKGNGMSRARLLRPSPRGDDS